METDIFKALLEDRWRNANVISFDDAFPELIKRDICKDIMQKEEQKRDYLYSESSANLRKTIEEFANVFLEI